MYCMYADAESRPWALKTTGEHPIGWLVPPCTPRKHPKGLPKQGGSGCNGRSLSLAFGSTDPACLCLVGWQGAVLPAAHQGTVMLPSILTFSKCAEILAIIDCRLHVSKPDVNLVGLRMLSLFVRHCDPSAAPMQFGGDWRQPLPSYCSRNAAVSKLRLRFLAARVKVDTAIVKQVPELAKSGHKS